MADLADLVSDGIPVARVPRASILDQLIKVDRSGRHNLLLIHEAEILEDCITSAQGIKVAPLAESAKLLTDGAVAAGTGHHSAAQALAANVLDTVLRITYPNSRGWYSAMRRTIADLQSDPELSNLRTGLALAPIMLAISEYDGRAGEIPDFYNRHATAHAAGQLQYTRINAIVAIMAATSALRECHELKWRKIPPPSPASSLPVTREAIAARDRASVP